MYLSELRASLRRRWYVLVVLLGIAAGLCWFASGLVKPTYEVKASLVLIPPKTVETPDANRYLNLGSLSDSVEVLARSMLSEETAQDLERVAPGATYEVDKDDTTSAPILLVLVEAPDPASATDLLEAALARVSTNLAELQRSIGIDAGNQITVVQVAAGPEPEVNRKGQVRVLAVLAAGLLLGAALLTAAIDGLVLRRAQRRAAAEDAPDPVEDPPTTLTAVAAPDRPEPDAGEVVQRLRRRGLRG
ncbi:YveK family protein [Nocardioides donggukensis]|uniref:Polysaccharide chain length determinant N-terminal domain-containing protein n=1 Tax=Nocardioides donggukensis TaxID=2774019 RepID=A0A927Q0C7_9ACTN|nr:hypothetical protein [Nocardioides donggukensis]MBD8870480.1 hypothetical protein [Nocardioides donggukensis]